MTFLNPIAPYMAIIKWVAALAIPLLIFAAGYNRGHAPVGGLRDQVKVLTGQRDTAVEDASAKGKALDIALDGLASARRTFLQLDAAAEAEAAAADRMQAMGERAAAVAVKENIQLHGDIAALNKQIEAERGLEDCAITGVPLQ